ncbi:MAG: transglutaminase family protein, partial [Planctomycetota bacterium]
MLGALVLLGGHAAAEDEPRDEILKLALEMAERDHPELDEAKVRSEIERMATVYRELLGTDPTPAQRADAFRTLLFEREKFESVADLESSRTLHIDTVLDRRKGYCLSLGIVALAVAERVGAPLHGVAAPNHFFVRFDDGTYRRNLELTRKGVEITDAEFRKRIGDSLPKDTIYMRNLTTKGIRACLLHNRGYVALAEGRLHYANRDLRRAARLGLGEAYRTLGVLYGEQKKWGQAKSYFIRALGLYPDDVDALINLAICRHALGEFDAALQDIEMVLVMKPGHQRALKLLTEWKEEKHAQPEQGKPREAMPAKPAGLKPGLRGRYFEGTWFEKQITERIDRTIDFDWQNSSPAPGVPRDRFSVRWEGYLKAPRTGTYTFFLAAN